MSGTVLLEPSNSTPEQITITTAQDLANYLLPFLDAAFAKLQNSDMQGQYVKMDAAADVLLDVRQQIHRFSSSGA